MQISKLLTASLDFSTALVRLVEDLMNQHESIVFPKIAQSGTMIGAYIHEAQFAPDKEAYVNKLQKALDATNQTAYWIDLLYRLGYVYDSNFHTLSEDCESMRGMIISAIEYA